MLVYGLVHHGAHGLCIRRNDARIKQCGIIQKQTLALHFEPKGHGACLLGPWCGRGDASHVLAPAATLDGLWEARSIPFTVCVWCPLSLSDLDTQKMVLEPDGFIKIFDGISLRAWFVCSWEILAEGKNLLKKQWNAFMEPFKGSAI